MQTFIFKENMFKNGVCKVAAILSMLRCILDKNKGANFHVDNQRPFSHKDHTVML